MFDQISPTYDFVNRVLSLGQDKRWRRKASQHLPARPHLQILDLATGTGDQLFSICEEGLSFSRMVGIDLSEEMMAIGRKKFDSTPFSKRVEFLRADAQNLPFAKDQFDAATISFGIRNIPDPLAALREMRRVLKQNGRALVLEFSTPPPWIRPFFLFYLRKILPRLGGLFSKNRAAYRYLNETIESFPSGETFCEMMRSAGFSEVRRSAMNLGSVTLYTGEKR